jgi:hypothetical protein
VWLRKVDTNCIVYLKISAMKPHADTLDEVLHTTNLEYLLISSINLYNKHISALLIPFTHQSLHKLRTAVMVLRIALFIKWKMPSCAY